MSEITSYCAAASNTVRTRQKRIGAWDAQIFTGYAFDVSNHAVPSNALLEVCNTTHRSPEITEKLSLRTCVRFSCYAIPVALNSDLMTAESQTQTMRLSHTSFAVHGMQPICGFLKLVDSP